MSITQHRTVRRAVLPVVVLVAALGCRSTPESNTQQKGTVPMTTDIHGFTVTDIDGKDVSLGQFRGKVLLIVNVASKCGFTPQYEGLQKLYDAYKDQGLVVLGFPCNQFGAQEQGESNEIASFCESRFQVSFPMFKKCDVNG